MFMCVGAYSLWRMSLSLITRYSGRRYRWAARNRHSNNQENNHQNSNQQKSVRSMMINVSGHNPTLQRRRRHLKGIHHRDMYNHKGTLRNKDTLHLNRDLRRNRDTLHRKVTLHHSKAILRNKDIMLGQPHADAEAPG